MESPTSTSAASDAKYQKLATEYSKLRAHATILKRAVLDEQKKTDSLTDQLRQRDTSLRRCEQEVDSLMFRNRQLEQRCAALQRDLHQPASGRPPTAANANSQPQQAPAASTDGTLLADELQMRIIENAQLATQLADRCAEAQRLTERCAQLDQLRVRQLDEHDQLERQLRADLDALAERAALLERRNGSVKSTAGSVEALVLPTDDGSAHADDRVRQLEREVFGLRAQLEFADVRDTPADELRRNVRALRRASNGPLGAPWTVSPNRPPVPAEPNADDEPDEQAIREQWMMRHFSAKMDRLFGEQLEQRSRAISYEKECEALQANLRLQREETERLRNDLLQSDENLSTTRRNYEEQISVLTEQVISLSDQLAYAS